MRGSGKSYYPGFAELFLVVAGQEVDSAGWDQLAGT